MVVDPNHLYSFLEHPPSKRFLSEELVASHLEHLKLSSDGRWDGDSHWDTDGRCRDGGHSSPAPGKREASARVTSAPRQLNIKTVASCPHSIDCQISRKRFLRDCGQSERSSKRMRLDSETRMFLPNTKNGNRTNHGMELDLHQHNRAAVLTSVHGVGNVSDLSSIPEEIEPSQQPRPSGGYGRTPSPEKELSQQHSTPSGIPYSVNSDVHEALTHLSLNLRPALSSAFLSPSPATTPPHPPLVTDTNIECSVWVAPEIQAMSRRAESLLPISIVEEM